MDPLDVHTQKLRSPDPSTRETAAHALYDLGEAASPAVPALLEALLTESGPCPWVGTAIVEIRPSAVDIPKLRDALHSANDHVRFWAARATVKLGPEASPLIDDLIGLLCDPHRPVMDSVLWALRSIGPTTIQPLVDAANRPNGQLRSRALIALGGYPDHITAVLPTIVNAVDADDSQVSRAAAHAICSLAQSAHPATIYDDSTLSTLVMAVERIITDPSIDIEPDWPQRILGWLRPGA